MRFHEILDENPLGVRVQKATQRKHDAMQRYSEKLRQIPKTTPAAAVGERQAKARQQYASAITKADDSIRP